MIYRLVIILFYFILFFLKKKKINILKKLSYFFINMIMGSYARESSSRTEGSFVFKKIRVFLAHMM